MRSIVIHGHFYQLPREDPWLGTLPREASAAPYHDWNERIERESYAPVAASLASLSFDFGPTLLAWMERYAAETYAAVLAADRIGNAIAMPYHHTILPLSSRRDKETEVRWGIADFRRRFGREPEGMWLPETAVDGETFGHHHREGAITLARVLDALRQRGDVRVDTFGAFLARHPPQEDVRLAAPSAWSCPHGVERWRSDCGCRVHGDRATHQRWRAPLRSALDWLAAELHRVFEQEGSTIFAADPWTVRDVYGSVLGAPDDAVTRFIGERLRRPDDRSALTRARELLELERHALRMFTSCGWFFDDIAGLESLIVLRSAARAIELTGTDAARLEAGLLERLALAPSNDPAVGTGRELYVKGVKAVPARGVPT